MPNPEIVIVSDRAALAHQAARRFVTIARDAVNARGRFATALSGGSTPRGLYALLSTPEFAPLVDWGRAHVFWADERRVPADHPDSNYRMAYETLLSRVPVPAQNIHRVLTELPPEDAATAYEETLRSQAMDAAQQSPQEIAIPRLDLILLGLGANGHTASLFPHTRVLHETMRWVAAEYIAEAKMYRITLTTPIINAAANILFLVIGMDKTTAVRDVLRGAYRPDDLPAQLVQPTNGCVTWLLDRDAARGLSDESVDSSHGSSSTNLAYA